MAAPSRGSEVTLVADNTSLAAGETTFDWDASAAFYGQMTLSVTFPASGQGNIDVYVCSTESSNSADYPARAQGYYVGSIVATASATVPQAFTVPQGLNRIRLYNNGTSAATAVRTRGRLYT